MDFPISLGRVARWPAKSDRRWQDAAIASDRPVLVAKADCWGRRPGVAGSGQARPGSTWGWGGLGIGWGRPGVRATLTSSFQIYTVGRMNSRL